MFHNHMVAILDLSQVTFRLPSLTVDDLCLQKELPRQVALSSSPLHNDVGRHFLISARRAYWTLRYAGLQYVYLHVF